MANMASRVEQGGPVQNVSFYAPWAKRFLIVLTILGIVFLIGIAFWALSQIAEPLLLMGVSIVFAYILYPLVQILERFLPRWLAILLVYVFLLGVLVLFSYYVVLTSLTQLAALIVGIQQSIPTLGQRFQSVTRWLNQLGVQPEQLNISAQQITDQLFGFVGNLPSILGALFSIAINIIIVATLSIYFVVDGPRVLRWIDKNTPKSRQGNVTFFMETTDHMMGGFLRGQLTLGVVMSVVVGCGLFLFGVPYALLLALLVLIMEFVPQIGAYISGTIIVIVTLATRGWQTALIVLVFVTLAQGILDGQILAPRILGKSVGLHPILSIFALLIGAKLFGLVGALISAPLAGMIQVLVIAYWKTYREQHPEEFRGKEGGQSEEGGSTISSEGDRGRPEERMGMDNLGTA